MIVVRRGKPVRLLFNRQEPSLCSEMVVFDKIGQSAKLPEGETVAIEFTPQETGEGAEGDRPGAQPHLPLGNDTVTRDTSAMKAASIVLAQKGERR